MKKVVEFWKDNEQTLTFLLIIVYLNAFWIYFYEEMANEGWVTGLWLIQFFGLSTWHGLRGVKKRWKLPKHIKDTH
jgi:hypothetical protein